jgi:hypothetical protein
MNIQSFKNINYTHLKETDDTQRNIGYSYFQNILLIGRNAYYPNTLLYDDINKNLISPYDEKIMSLNKDSFYDNNIYDYTNKPSSNLTHTIINIPVYFLIYNFDNYYHFLYDTLPYLYTYLELKKKYPYKNIKLLINYPNPKKKEFYKFNIELLEKVIDINDLITHNENNIYKELYVSSSLTHGGFSNNKPRKEIYEIYDIIKSNINYANINKQFLKNTINKLYISRRTWINNDISNIGTNYTTRRKMINEDLLVEELTKNNDYTEIFAENLNTDEKIYLFSNATKIIGSIGGGMANLLFSNPLTKTYILVTPYFLDINYRFKYSMENTDITYFYDINTYTEHNKIPLHCRVKIINKISAYYEKYGEISEYNKENDTYLVNISNNDVAGFNNLITFNNDYFNQSEFELLDNGLNSPYITNISKLLKIII